jgi:hypothetical protein
MAATFHMVVTCTCRMYLRNNDRNLIERKNTTKPENLGNPFDFNCTNVGKKFQTRAN